MKFIHIADVHLGAAPDKGHPWSKKREEEIWQSLERVVGVARQEQADLLLIAGDLFHRPPLLRELKEVNDLFESLAHTYVALIAGNHDPITRDSLYRGFSWAENVVFLDKPQCERVYFRDLDTTVYGFSYYQKEITEPLYDDLTPEEGGGCHILLAHGGDERHIPIDKNRLAKAGFDYVALGHIHKPHSLLQGRAIYAGALEPIDPNDTGAHGYIRGEYSGRGRLHTEFVPFAAREYVHLTLESDKHSTDFSMREKLARAIAGQGAQNIYKVELTGIRAPEILYHTDAYESLGNILDVSDLTEPDYDFAALYEAHRGDVIGRYMEKLLPEGEQEQPVRMRALYYGLDALLTKK